MGKASSSKKVARVAKTGGGRTKRGGQARSLLFPSVIILTVVLGVVLIWVSRDAREVDASPPQPGDHWHSAIGFYICDSFAGNLPNNDNDPLGIHGHGDGIVHVHPFTSLAGGDRARLGLYFDALQVDVTDSKIDIGIVDAVEEGEDDCDGEPATVQMKVWDTRAESDPGRIVTGDPGDLRLRDNQLITVAFVPEGTDIPRPESEPTLDNLSDVPSASTTPPADAGTTVPGDTTETTVAGDTATTVPGETETTVAGEATTTTAAP